MIERAGKNAPWKCPYCDVETTVEWSGYHLGIYQGNKGHP